MIEQYVSRGAGIPTRQTLTFPSEVLSITVYNNSPAAIDVSDQLQPAFGIGYVDTLPPFYAKGIALNPTRQVYIVTDGTVPFATSSLSLVVSDQPLGAPFTAAFGSATWGAGSVPNTLVAVNPGDQLLAWQVQQLINALTGVMTNQAFNLNNSVQVDSLDVVGASVFGGNAIAQAFLSVLGRMRQAEGAQVPSANHLTLGNDGNSFILSGTTQVNLLDVTGWPGGSIVSFLAVSLTVKHNQASSGNFTRMILAGMADIVAGANGVYLTLVYLPDTAGGAAWREVCRATF